MNSDTKFSKDEWETCLKVLSILKDEPLNNPDNETFKTLITKIHKKAKKSIRQTSFQDKKNNKKEIILNTQIASHALNNSTEYTEKEENIHYTKSPLPLNCYICNKSFTQVHSFYNRLCPECAEYNYEQRFISIDLKKRNVILTGGRVKIGYATTLKVLRSGANLLLTSRFPALTLESLKKEKDYDDWKERLFIYGLDLKNLKAVEDFTSFVKNRYTHLDLLINNAAQTIKYPEEYYIPLIQKEKQNLLIYKNEKLLENATPLRAGNQLLEYNDNFSDFTINRFGQPADLRNKNSWNSTLEEISMYELMEVNLINQISPYFLIKELKNLFLKSSFKERFIINVTSSEGQFSYSNKTIFHPHTNMTKAALNMMTRTSAKDFVSDSLYMNSVDVGWISTGATEKLRKSQFEKGYIPPLDSVDGASRILHPVKEIISGNGIYGKLLKNYQVTEW